MLPTEIRLGHKIIPVRYETGGELADLFGDSTEYPPLIRINSAYPEGVQAETLLHEILHHIGWLYGLDWEEPIVRGLESSLLGLMRGHDGLWESLLGLRGSVGACEGTLRAFETLGSREVLEGL